MTMRTSWPSAFNAFGSAPATSASPPTLANGATSAATNRIFNLSVAIKSALSFTPSNQTDLFTAGYVLYPLLPDLPPAPTNRRWGALQAPGLSEVSAQTGALAKPEETLHLVQETGDAAGLRGLLLPVAELGGNVGDASRRRRLWLAQGERPLGAHRARNGRVLRDRAQRVQFDPQELARDQGQLVGDRLALGLGLRHIDDQHQVGRRVFLRDHFDGGIRIRDGRRLRGRQHDDLLHGAQKGQHVAREARAGIYQDDIGQVIEFL